MLLAIFGLGLVIAGIFVTDPALDYPPGAPMGGPQTLHGTIHGLARLVDFLALAVACFILARRFAGDRRRGWSAYSIITGVLVLMGFIASNVTAVLDASGALPNARTGLLQHITIVLGWGWIALLALPLDPAAGYVWYADMRETRAFLATNDGGA